MLTYHLGRKVPADRQKCRMAIDGPDERHVVSWDEGESPIFDDMYNHEVWNETGEDRYILLIQVKRPCRSVANASRNLFLLGVRYSRFVQDIRRNIDKQKPG